MYYCCYIIIFVVILLCGHYVTLIGLELKDINLPLPFQVVE
jgi:hypothetical protein